MATIRGNPVVWDDFYKTARWRRLRKFQLAKGFALDIPIAVGRPDANNDQHYPGETVFTGGWS
jgi:hypothetical protein